MLDKLAPSLLALAALIAAGAGLQALLPAPLERGRTARFGLAYLLGAAWVGLGAWAVNFVSGFPLGRALFAALIALPVVAGGAALVASRSWRGLAGAGERRSRAERWIAALVAFVIAAQAIALLAHAAAEPVIDFDGRMTWGVQARYLQAGASVLPEVLLDERAFVIHPRYPILLPLLQVASAEISGLPLDGFGVRPLYALFLPAFAAALWPALRRAGGARGGALGLLLLFVAPIFLTDANAGPLGTFSDFPLAAFLGLGLAQLLHPGARREPWRGWAAGLLLAAAAGSKNEGMVLAAAALALATFVSRRADRRWFRPFVRAGAVLTLALVLIVAWRSQIPNRNDEGYFENASLSTLFANLPVRIGPVGADVVSRTFDRDEWGWLFWIAPPLLLLGARGLRRRASRAAALLVAVEIGLAFAAYSVVGELRIVGVTWNRFLLQVSAPWALLLSASSGRVLASLRQNASRSRPPQN